MISVFQAAKRTKMARNGVSFTGHFPASQASLQNTAPHSSRHFTFTYDDLYNCLYRHNELQLIDIEAFKAQRKSSHTDAERQKEATSKLTKQRVFVTLRAKLKMSSNISNVISENLIFASGTEVKFVLH